MDRTFIEFQKNFTGRVYEELLLERGLYPGVKTPVKPDEAGEVDADHILQGLGVGGMRRPRRVRRVS